MLNGFFLHCVEVVWCRVRIAVCCGPPCVCCVMMDDGGMHVRFSIFFFAVCVSICARVHVCVCVCVCRAATVA